jgi:hypothetical protein
LTKIYFDSCYNLQIVDLPLEKVIYIELEKVNWIDKVTNLCYCWSICESNKNNSSVLITSLDLYLESSNIINCINW